MSLRSAGFPLPSVIFDAELSAYGAALSEGWPLHHDRADARRTPATDEPSSAVLDVVSPQRARPARIAA